MRYVLVLALGILTGLAFNRLPHYQPFRNETPPATPGDWKPRATGPWSEEDRATIDRYASGGINLQEWNVRSKARIKGVQAWDANGVEIADAQAKWERGEL